MRIGVGRAVHLICRSGATPVEGFGYLGSAKGILRAMLPTRAVAAARRVLLRRRSELPVVEVLVTSHCNLSCKGCNAFAPLSESRFADPEQFDKDIRRLAGLFDSITQIGIVGGEPLLHPDVCAFMRSARSASPESEVYLVSNGLLLASSPDEFWEEMRRQSIKLKVSDYALKLDRSVVERIALSNGVDLEFLGPRSQFWMFPIEPAGTCDAAHSFQVCRQLVSCPSVANGRLYLCDRVAVAGLFERASGLSLPVSENDYIDIYSDIDAFEIQERLMHPLDWCRFCDVDAKRVFDWETGRRSPEEWTK